MYWFVLGIYLHKSLNPPKNLNGTIVKGGFVRQKNVLGKCSLVNCVSSVFSGLSRIRLWPPRHDDRSGVLIGVGGTRRSDWPESAFAINVRARSGG